MTLIEQIITDYQRSFFEAQRGTVCHVCNSSRYIKSSRIAM